MRIGRRLFVGASHRSNRAGIEQLAAELAPFGYTVVAVEVRGALHLKTACCYVGDGAILANRKWLDTEPLPASASWTSLQTSREPPTCLQSGVPSLCRKASRGPRRFSRAGRKVRPVDVSELMKAEAGVTCSSLVFDY